MATPTDHHRQVDHDQQVDHHRSTTIPDDGPHPGLRRWGALAAAVEALTFVVGIAMAVTVLSEYATGDLTPAESVTFMVENRGALFAWFFVTLIVFAVALVPLVLSLYDRLRASAPALARVGAVFGLIWAGLIVATGMVLNVGSGAVVDLAGSDPGGAASLWSALDAVADGLGGGNEVVGGMWVLLVSVAAMRTGALPRTLNVVGILSAVAGLVTVVPGLEDIGMVFGLGLIVWFAWVAAVLLGHRDPA